MFFFASSASSISSFTLRFVLDPDHLSRPVIISHFSSHSFLPSTFVFLFLLIIDYPITLYSLLSPSSLLPRSTDRCFVISHHDVTCEYKYSDFGSIIPERGCGS